LTEKWKLALLVGIKLSAKDSAPLKYFVGLSLGGGGCEGILVGMVWCLGVLGDLRCVFGLFGVGGGAGGFGFVTSLFVVGGGVFGGCVGFFFVGFLVSGGLVLRLCTLVFCSCRSSQ